MTADDPASCWTAGGHRPLQWSRSIFLKLTHYDCVVVACLLSFALTDFLAEW